VADGISPETMVRLVREGVAIRQARGVYPAADAPLDARHLSQQARARSGARGTARRLSATPHHVDQLTNYARNARTWTVMRPYMEAVATNGA
jgi:hypothetical protein